MTPSFRGKISIAILVALAFSTVLFVDVAIFTAFLISLFLVMSAIIWVVITTGMPGRFYSSSKTLQKQNEICALNAKTYPGEEVGFDFYFLKKGRGEIVLSSKIPYLELEPKKISRRSKVTKVHAKFKTPFSGEYLGKELDILAGDPLGFFQGSCSIPISLEFIVYPKLKDIALTTMKILGRGGIGETPINSAGIGTEPYEMRQYQSGDDMRQVNWKATARVGELMVTEHAREVGASYYVVLEAVAPDLFDRDRLASTFLQISNSLTMLNARYGVIVHDGEQVTALRRLDEHSSSLEFALEAALEFVELKQSKLQTRLAFLPSQTIKSSRDSLSLLGFELLSRIEESGRVNMRNTMKEEPFNTIMGLVGEYSDEPPAVFYVSGLFNSIDSIVETGSHLRRTYGSEFIVISPVAPWVVAQGEEEGVLSYERQRKNIETLTKSGIRCYVGEPLKIVHELLSD